MVFNLKDLIKSKKKNRQVNFPMPSWTYLFPNKENKEKNSIRKREKCSSLGEAFVCLLDSILY